MPGQVLKVLARGTAKVPLHSAHMHGMARFVGREYDEKLGDGVLTKGGYRSLRTPTAVEQINADGTLNIDFNETIRALRDGDLWACDKATAVAAGVALDPNYGGEYPPVDAKTETKG